MDGIIYHYFLNSGDFSYLFSSIYKRSGTSPWELVFAYIAGLIANSSSVNKIAEHCNDAPVLKEILGGNVPSQLLAKVYQRLIRTGNSGECVSISIPGIYIKLSKVKQNKSGKLIKKQVYTPIAAVANCYIRQKFVCTENFNHRISY